MEPTISHYSLRDGVVIMKMSGHWRPSHYTLLENVITSYLKSINCQWYFIIEFENMQFTLNISKIIRTFSNISVLKVGFKFILIDSKPMMLDEEAVALLLSTFTHFSYAKFPTIELALASIK